MKTVFSGMRESGKEAKNTVCPAFKNMHLYICMLNEDSFKYVVSLRNIILCEGHGKLIMNDGSYYEGEFQDGEIEGHGFRYYSLSGNTYSGKFHLGELQGQGVMKFLDGSVYEGEWKRNKRQGDKCINYTHTSKQNSIVTLYRSFV